jgi:hypothetical protein
LFVCSSVCRLSVCSVRSSVLFCLTRIQSTST